jgi:SpoVK/Ycf46/Vps4 family AAA+-type ATPase
MSEHKFKIGDEVTAIEGSPYSITKFNNGSGIVTKWSDDDDDDDDMYVAWTEASGKKHDPMGVRSRWFVVKKHVTPKQAATKISLRKKESVRSFVERLLKVEKDAERRKWLSVFNRCILPDDVRAMVEEAIVLVMHRDLFEKWGFFEHYEKGLTNSILLHGPPGTGKTMISESIAAVLGKNLMTLATRELQSNIPGQVERNIDEAFNRAKAENAVVLLDECDSLLSDRNDVGTIMAAEINALLTAIERFDGVVILTTNRLHVLDPALQRRIVAKVEVKMPTFDARKQIWVSSLPSKMPIGEVDFAVLAEKELSGGDIKNAVMLAARKAIARGDRRVEMEHFVAATEMVWSEKRAYEKTRPQRVCAEVQA